MCVSKKPSAGSDLFAEGLLDPIRQLVRSAPGVPFLCLGQTIFWDEPLKAVVGMALRALHPEADLVLAVHDTDYFARPHTTLSSTRPYVILPHNAGSTRDLWCAAGELSQLFGAETIPSRSFLRSAGVRLDVAARFQGRSPRELLDEASEAWGWRGIVHTSGLETLTYEVPVRDIRDTLLELLDWGLSRSAESLCHCIPSSQADELRTRLMDAVTLATAQHADGSLSDVYQALFPFLVELASGQHPEHTSVSHSMSESVFNTETARLQRYRILDLFLRPESRSICMDAYNHSVEGSEIYPLDRFGLGAIPFDLVTSHTGRGTLRITNQGIHVDGRRLDFIPTEARVESAAALAAAVVDFYGQDVNLVGKAITWIAIMAADHIFVFNEGASAYTQRTRQMLGEMREHGVLLDVHPLLRVRYGAWDALESVPSGFCLPDHFAEAFGQREISAADFAARWRTVMDEQEKLLLRIKALSRPADLLDFLRERSPQRWAGTLQDYLRAQMDVRSANACAPEMRRTLEDMRQAHYDHGLDIDRLHKRLGEIRAILQETSSEGAGQDEALERERASIHAQIDTHRVERSQLRLRSQEIRSSTAARIREPSYQSSLAALRRIEAEAEYERIRLVRNAYMVAHSLEHNNRRPTAWWLPLVSPDGSWFRAICHNATAAIEDLN